MIKQLWINLPVKDVKVSKAFFVKLGFSFNPEYGDSDTSLCLIVDEKKTAVMLFEEKQFRQSTMNEITDTRTSNELIISFSAETREQVDEMAKKAEAAGANVFSKPEELQGWMYNFAFADPDGHRWNMLYMDMEKMPK